MLSMPGSSAVSRAGDMVGPTGVDFALHPGVAS